MDIDYNNDVVDMQVDSYDPEPSVTDMDVDPPSPAPLSFDMDVDPPLYPTPPPAWMAADLAHCLDPTPASMAIDSLRYLAPPVAPPVALHSAPAPCKGSSSNTAKTVKINLKLSAPAHDKGKGPARSIAPVRRPSQPGLTSAPSSSVTLEQTAPKASSAKTTQKRVKLEATASQP
nr:hypothetical protein HK105_004435 [Polyrhizophydium stewartii]